MQTVINESDCIKYVWHNITKVGMERVTWKTVFLLDSVSKNQNDSIKQTLTLVGKFVSHRGVV